MDYKKLVNFFFESGMMTRMKRIGDYLAGNSFPETLADHTYRALIISFFLSKLEKADENKVLKMLLFYNIHQTRTLNLHRVACRYIDTKKAKKLAFQDQLDYFPEEIKKELRKLQEEYENDSSKEAKVASDAKCLASSLAAKEATERGIDMNAWIEKDEQALETESAKLLMKELKKAKSTDWWKNLKYFPKMKLGEKKFD